jgi:hypothetical protein
MASAFEKIPFCLHHFNNCFSLDKKRSVSSFAIFYHLPSSLLAVDDLEEIIPAAAFQNLHDPAAHHRRWIALAGHKLRKMTA